MATKSKKSLSNLHKQTMSAQKRWHDLRSEFFQNVTEESAKGLSLTDAQQIVAEILREDNSGRRTALIHLIKANPLAIPKYFHVGAWAPYNFWSMLAILAEHGDKENAKTLLDFCSNSIPEGCNWHDISKVAGLAFDRLGLKCLSFFRAVLQHANHAGVMKYLEVRKLDQLDPGDKLDFSEVEELRDRLLNNDRDYYWAEHKEILMAVPEISTRKFWDKWLDTYRGDKDIELIKDVGGVALDALHAKMQRCDNPRSVRGYLKAFPDIDKEPFIKKIAEGFAPDPMKMARDYLTGEEDDRSYRGRYIVWRNRLLGRIDYRIPLKSDKHAPPGRLKMITKTPGH